MKKKSIARIVLPLILTIVLLGLLWLVSQSYSSNKRMQNLLTDANAHLLDENYAEALAAFNSALAIDDQNIEGLQGLIRTNLESGNYSEAQTWLEQLAEIDSAGQGYRALLYQYALQTGDFALAESILASQEDYQPTSDEYRQIALGLARADFYPKASEIIKQAMEEYPSVTELRYVAFEIFRDNGDKEELISLYEDGLVIDSVQDFTTLASAYDSLAKPEEAAKLREFSLAIELNQPQEIRKLLNYYHQTYDISSWWLLRQNLLENNLEFHELSTKLSGNTAQNTRYKGFAAEQAGRVYYADSENGYLHRTAVGSLNRSERILEQKVEGINYSGNWLYFVLVDENRNLYRMRETEREPQLVIESSVKSPLVWGNSIYYIDLDDGNRLKAVSLDGQQNKVEIDLPVEHYALDGSYIYFTGLTDQDLYRAPLNGGSSEKIRPGQFSDINVDEFSRLYFLNKETGEILSCENDGSDYRVIGKGDVQFLNYSNSYLYFVSWTPHRISVNGGEEKNLTSNLSEELIVFSEWVFSLGSESENSENKQLYVFRSDGTNWAVLNPSMQR